MKLIQQLINLFKERFTVPLSCLGIGLVSTWSELSFINPPYPFNVPGDILFQVFNIGTVILAIIVMIGIQTGFIKTALVACNRNLLLAAIIMILSTCLSLSVALFNLETPWLVVIAAALGGAGMTLFFVMWFEVLSHLNPLELLLCFSLGAIGRVTLIWLCEGMALERFLFCMCAIAIAGMLTLKKARDGVAKSAPVVAEIKSDQTASSPVEKACSFPIKPLLVIITSTTALSFVQSLAGNAGGINGNPGVLVAALCVTIAVLIKGERFEFKWLWQGSVAFIMVFIILFIATGPTFPMLSNFIVCMSYELSMMMIYSILGDLVYRSYYNSTFLFAGEIAIALAAGTATHMLFALFSESVFSQSVIIPVIISTLLAALFAVAAIRAFSKRNLSEHWGAIIRKPIAYDIDLLKEKSRLGLRCHTLAQEAGLSDREEEVLLLVAQRKKPAEIAHQLVIEVSTVNTHKKHIYRKLDVHSAKELQERIGSVDSG